MIKNVLTEIGGIGIYGVISVCLFFTVFTGVVVHALRLKKPALKHASLLPLDDGSTAPHPEGVSHD